MDLEVKQAAFSISSHPRNLKSPAYFIEKNVQRCKTAAALFIIEFDWLEFPYYWL